MNIRQLLVVVSSIVIVLFSAAHWYVWQHAGSPRDFSYLNGFIKLIGSLLATNFGAVLFLNRIKQQSGEPKAELWKFESAAAYAYLAMLILAAILWKLEDFDVKYVEAIRNLALTLPSILVGALALTVNTNVDSPAKEDLS